MIMHSSSTYFNKYKSIKPYIHTFEYFIPVNKELYMYQVDKKRKHVTYVHIHFTLPWNIILSYFCVESHVNVTIACCEPAPLA